MTLRYLLVISDALPRTTLETVRRRFVLDGLDVENNSTSLSGAVQDEPALRALLTLIWDMGGHVQSLTTEPAISVSVRRDDPP